MGYLLKLTKQVLPFRYLPLSQPLCLHEASLIILWFAYSSAVRWSVCLLLDTHTPEKRIVCSKLLSCLLWCAEQPTCLESSQLAFILADGKSRKPLGVGREAIFIHSVASTAKW